MAFGSSAGQSGFSIDFKEQVRARTNLVDLVGESITLTAKNAIDHVGLCPFHDDHNPSFHVYTDRQRYRCWVCEEAGDCYTFVMKYDRVGFREALEMLAERAGLDMPKNMRSQTPEQRDQKKRWYDLVAWAESLFHRTLLSDPVAAEARAYLQSRGFTQETIEEFRLGFHPDNRTWLVDCVRRGTAPYQTSDLIAVGLATESKYGYGDQDTLTGRVVFPIRDFRSRNVAFGGRVLPNSTNASQGKYWNSPETPLFTKNALVYGFDQARDEVKRTDTVVVMEGYTDCIMAWQYGVKNVVATLGTALTENHVSQLKRFARQVVLVYDGDDAGQKASERALARFLAQDVDLRILTLPEGQDPADFLSQHGADAFREQIAAAVEAWEHKLNLAIGRYGVSTVDGKQRVLEELVELMAGSPRLAGSPRETFIINRLSSQLGIDERQVRQQLSEARKPKPQRRFEPAHQTSNPQQPSEEASPRTQDTNEDTIERELLELIFAVPSTVARIQQEIGPDALRNESLRSLLQLCFDLWEEGDDPTYEKVTASLEDPELKRLAVRIDHDAELKSVERLVRESKPVMYPNSGVQLPYLEYVISQLKVRCERALQEPLKSRMTGLSGGASTDGSPSRDEQMKLLSQLQNYHAKRATT